jgi:multiple sugar transport system ATP-binding protein
LAGVTFRDISKVFGKDVRAVDDLNLEIRDKEFMVLVGPSGCGKTTALRMVAGLEETTAGDIFIGDVRVNDTPPKDRDIAMVFQNYALYPHMNVYDNIAFGLRLRELKSFFWQMANFNEAKRIRADIDTRVREVAKMLDIDKYLHRRPKELSGGQPATACRPSPRDREKAKGLPHGRASVEPRRQAPNPDKSRAHPPPP